MTSLFAFSALSRVVAFNRDVQKILAQHESSKARLITIEETYSKLAKLSVKQDQLLRQSLGCVEAEVYRAAHVMAWSAVMDFLEERIASDGFAGLRGLHPNWGVATLDDLRDTGSDFQIIEALRRLGHCTKTEERALKGLLNKRNECAHPTDYFPDLNESLGYISEILRRIETFQKRWAPAQRP